MVLMTTLASLTEMITMLILTTKRVRLWRGGEGVREASDDDAGPVRVEPVSYTHLTLPTTRSV